MYNMKQSSSLKELSYFTCLDKLLPSICWLSCVLTVGCVWLSKNKFSSYLPFLRNTILKYEKSSLTLDIGHIYWIPCSGKIWRSINWLFTFKMHIIILTGYIILADLSYCFCMIIQNTVQQCMDLVMEVFEVEIEFCAWIHV